MSEKLPESRPVLMPRSNGNIEVWHKTGMLDGHGNHQVISQVPEEIDGKISLVKKYVPEEFFSSEVQDDYAEELGMDRPTLTPEQLDRHFKADKDLGEVSLTAVDVKSPDVDSKPSHVDHLNNLLNTREETAEVREEREVAEIADFIGDIKAKAGRGEIKSGKGETYSPDYISGQLDYFVGKLDDPDVDIDNLLRLIPRSGGLRTVLGAMLKDGSNDILRKAVAASRTESSVHPKAIAEAPVAEVEAKDPLAELTKGLSDTDINHLQYFASALQQKKRAQDSDNGAGSTMWGQKAGEHMRDLTPAAAALAYRYADIYSRI